MIMLALAMLIGGGSLSSAAIEPVLVPAGTSVQLETVVAVDSQSAVQGQRFGLRVSKDVNIGSQVIIPRGTLAVGEVEAVSGKGMFGKAGRLVLQPLFIDIGGERVNLSGTIVDGGHDGTTAAAVTTALVGAWGLFITGKSATVPAGSSLSARVRTDISLPAPAAPPSVGSETRGN